jgi:DNA-binding HxlR family transcriptional regulator
MSARNAPSKIDLETRSSCAVAGTLDLLGDKWTLLLIRDLNLFGTRRFGEFLQAPEGIPTNLLAERLKRLEHAGLVSRQAYQQQPPRYEYRLTPAGEDLKPVLAAIREWGRTHLEGRKPPQWKGAQPALLQQRH